MSNARRAKGKSRPYEDDRLPAACALLGHTGAEEVQIRYCNEERPTVWMAIGRWGKTYECAAAMAPHLAVFRLCDQVIDGGMCAHCYKPTGFSPDLDTLPLDRLVCWYQWDPSHKEFRRGCKDTHE